MSRNEPTQKKNFRNGQHAKTCDVSWSDEGLSNDTASRHDPQLQSLVFHDRRARSVTLLSRFALKRLRQKQFLHRGRKNHKESLSPPRGTFLSKGCGSATDPQRKWSPTSLKEGESRIPSPQDSCEELSLIWKDVPESYSSLTASRLDPARLVCGGTGDGRILN